MQGYIVSCAACISRDDAKQRIARALLDSLPESIVSMSFLKTHFVKLQLGRREQMASEFQQI